MKDARRARRPEELDRAWAQAVLDSRAPGRRVRSVTPKSSVTGTTTRIILVVEHDGPADLARRWFVKLPSRSLRARLITALPGLYRTELRFYAELAAGLPLLAPPLIAAVPGGPLVLGELSEIKARPGRPRDALSPDQAEAAVRDLARLHAAYWQRPELDGALSWLGGPVRRLEDLLGSALASPLMSLGLARAGDLVVEGLRAPALGYARRRRRAMAFLSRGPRTLVHHDCHPGNLFWRGPEVGFLDWQLVRVGEGVGDVAYLLATALEPEERRAHEDRLLEVYAAALRAGGVDEPGDLAARYRAHLVYPFEAMVLTLGIGGLMDEDATRILLGRAAVAVADHGAFERVEEGG